MVALQIESAFDLYGIRSLALPVMVVLGNPKNPDCSHHGICRVYETGIPHEPCRCRHQTFAWLRSTETGILSFVFQKNFIRSEAMESFFTDDCFLVQDTYHFSERMALKMGFDAGKMNILPGAYKIIRTTDSLEVRFETC